MIGGDGADVFFERADPSIRLNSGHEHSERSQTTFGRLRDRSTNPSGVPEAGNEKPKVWGNGPPLSRQGTPDSPRSKSGAFCGAIDSRRQNNERPKQTKVEKRQFHHGCCRRCCFNSPIPFHVMVERLLLYSLSCITRFSIPQSHPMIDSIHHSTDIVCTSIDPTKIEHMSRKTGLSAIEILTRGLQYFHIHFMSSTPPLATNSFSTCLKPASSFQSSPTTPPRPRCTPSLPRTRSRTRVVQLSLAHL